MSFKPNMNFLKNNFQIRSDTRIYDPKNSSAAGLIREKIKQTNNRNAFVDANILTGDFIAQVFADSIPEGCDFLFDDFLAAAKISKALDVTSPDFKPFFAIVNVPEISLIPTPTEQTDDPAYNRAIREIVIALGVFKLYNFYGQFTVPNYGDPVQVTFKDMDTFSDPIFIAPLKTGQVNFAGGSGQAPFASSTFDECSSKPNVKTRIVGGKKAPPSLITSRKINKFITNANQIEESTKKSTFGTKDGHKDTPTKSVIEYKILIPKSTDKNKPINVFLYFHGNGRSGYSASKMASQGPSYIPDGHNVVMIFPKLERCCADRTTVLPGFILEVLQQNGMTKGVASVVTFSHSGGGGPHGWFLYHVAQTGDFDNYISATRFLDSDYGFSSIKKLFNPSTKKFTKSKVTFVVGKTGVPLNKATEGSGNNWNNIYNTGSRLIKTKNTHMKLAWQVGPEYLIPNVLSASPKPAEAPVEGTIKEDPNKKAEQAQQENIAKQLEAEIDADDGVTPLSQMMPPTGLEEPKKPNQKKEDSVTPNTKDTVTPTDTQTAEKTCSFNNFNIPGGPFPDDLQWVKIGNLGPRVHKNQAKRKLGWGTIAMKRFLQGLNNVKGGEHLGKGYINPKGKGKGNFQMMPDPKPGWWFGDVSYKEGGDNRGHKTHESGIGVDIALPTKYIDPSGKVYYGMCIRQNVSKSGNPGPPGSCRAWNLDKPEYYDERAMMDFFRYAIPQCERILLGEIGKAIFIRLVEDYSKNNKNGWSLSHPAYKQAMWRGRRREKSGLLPYKDALAKKQICWIYGEDQVHRDHFHIRLRMTGIAPGPFKGTDARPGIDKKGGWGPKVGDGRLDSNSPGYVPKGKGKAAY